MKSYFNTKKCYSESRLSTSVSSSPTFCSLRHISRQRMTKQNSVRRDAAAIRRETALQDLSLYGNVLLGPPSKLK